MIAPLDDVVVVDVTTEIAGAYCTKLFADAGATVLKVEPPEGDPLRRHAATTVVPEGEDGALFRYLHRGKRSLVARSGLQRRVEPLLEGADLLVDDGRLDVGALHRAHPHLVIVSITPFGRTGPMVGLPATDLTLQAESGSMTFKGDPRRAPVVAGGRVAEFFGGLFAAPAALAALARAQRTGRGELIDVSMHDVMAIAGSNYSTVMDDLRGRPIPTAPARYIDTPGIEQALDGLVAFNTNAGHMMELFLLMVERPDLVGDPAVATPTGRLAMGDAWQRIIDDWVSARTVDEIIDTAVAMRVPVARVHDGASVLHDEHLTARGVFVRDADGLVHPRPPYRIDDDDLPSLASAPRLGEHDEITVPTAIDRPPSQTSTGLPLAGLRVVDLTSWWVGALATQTLALLGADVVHVVHVEGVAHPDGMRLTGSSFARTEDWWEWGHMFAAANAGKRGITLDLATDDGRALLWRLIERADVLVENFAPRVAESWGLTREAVLERNPRIVYQRMPAYGLTGPWRDRPAFAQTIEPMSTMASITGYDDSRPLSKGGIPDPIAGMHGAWAALVALTEARRRGRGVFCEATMIEAALNVCAQPALEASTYGTVMTRRGNHVAHTRQDVFPAVGVDAWLAVSGLDHVDDDVAALAASLDPHEAASRLRSDGVDAAACWDCRLIAEHPQYVERELFTLVDHPVLGRHRVPGLPLRFASVDRWVTRPAPTFGQHNDEVLREIGLDERVIAELRERSIIASRPRGL